MTNILCNSIGILEVLHCILVESPEALNIIQKGHIKSIVSLLYKHGRNHKVRRNIRLEKVQERSFLCQCQSSAISSNFRETTWLHTKHFTGSSFVHAPRGV